MRTIRLIPAVLAIFALAAFQVKSATLDEAKRITAEFEGSSFIPPPRSINDITLILDEQARDNADAVEAARKQADETPPGQADTRQLAEFFKTRARAANVLGRAKQVVADHQQAVGYFRQSKADLGVPLWDLGRAEVFAGNYGQGITALRESLTRFNTSIAQGNYDLGFFVTVSGSLAGLLAESGDFDEAEQMIRSGEELLSQFAEYVNPVLVTFLDISLAYGRASILTARGKFSKGESSLRLILAGITKEETLTIKIVVPGLDVDQMSLHVLYGRTIAKLADNLRLQGRLLEAENVIREALLAGLKFHGRNSGYTAGLIRQLGTVLYEQGRYEEAEILARAAIGVFLGIGTPPDSATLAEARILRADALAGQGRLDDALTEFERVRADLSKDEESFERLAAGNINWANALLEKGEAEAALALLRPALDRRRQRFGEADYGVAELEGITAAALAVLGKREEALAGFKKSTSILMAPAGRGNAENSLRNARDDRLATILEHNIGVLADIRGSPLEERMNIDAAAEAFLLAEVARSRSVQRALAASGVRAAAGNPELAGLVRRDQDNRKRIAALYSVLSDGLSRPSDQQNTKTLASLKTAIGNLEGALLALRREIEARFPAYAELINPKPVTIEGARGALRAGESLISIYVGGERTYIWAVSNRGAVKFATVELGREQLSEQVALLRGALDSNAEVLGDIPEFDVALAYGLFENLLEPVKAGWKNANSLLVVAHGPLGYLPLPVLPTEKVAFGPESESLFARYRGVPWLARTHAVTMLPSVASLKTLRGLPPGDDARLAFAGFGDPWFSHEQAAMAALPKAQPQQEAALASRGIKTRGLRLRAAPRTTGMDSAELARLPRLPDTADEINSIAVALNANLTESVFLGRDANEDHIKSLDLSGVKVLAFATHGLVPGDLDGLVQPALAFTSPQVTGGKNDGLLTMGEILELKLNADWVVLSACNTGIGQGAGAEAVSGLGRAFFYAGTRALLVSNWPVESTSAKALTTDLFKRQAADPRLTRAEALRRAMVGLIDGPGYVEASGKVVYSYAHPLFWAPFSLIGDGGGGRRAP